MSPLPAAERRRRFERCRRPTDRPAQGRFLQGDADYIEVYGVAEVIGASKPNRGRRP
jgi:hypothetical protein